MSPYRTTETDPEKLRQLIGLDVRSALDYHREEIARRVYSRLAVVAVIAIVAFVGATSFSIVGREQRIALEVRVQQLEARPRTLSDEQARNAISSLGPYLQQLYDRTQYVYQAADAMAADCMPHIRRRMPQWVPIGWTPIQVPDESEPHDQRNPRGPGPVVGPKAEP